MDRVPYCSQHTDITLSGVRYVDSLYKVPQPMQQSILSRTGSESYDQSEVMSQSSEGGFDLLEFNHSSVSSDEELKQASKKLSDNNSGQNDILKTTAKGIMIHSTQSVLVEMEKSKARKRFRNGKYEDPETQLKNMPPHETIEQQAFENHVQQSGDGSQRVCLRVSSKEETKLIQNLERENFLLKQQVDMLRRGQNDKNANSRDFVSSFSRRGSESNGQENRRILEGEELEESMIIDSERAPQTASNPTNNRLLQITDCSINSGTTKPKQRNSKKDRLMAEEKELLQNEDMYEIPEVQIDSFPRNRKKNQLQVIGCRLFRKFHKISVPQEEIIIQTANLGEKLKIRFHYDEQNTIEWDSEGNFYIGNCRSHYKEGLGFQIIEGEEKYVGNFHKGLRHGIGRMRNITGQYIGSWVQGVKEGFGEEIDIEGNIYKGEWKQDKYHGDGQIFYSKGHYFKGKFENGMKSGYGEWYESMDGGDKYKGNYVKDKRHGYGEYFHSDSGNVKKGYFRNGIRIDSARSKKSVEKKPSLGKIELLQRKKTHSLTKSARKYSIYHQIDSPDAVILPNIYQSHQPRNQLALKKPLRSGFSRHANLPIYGEQLPSPND